MSPNTFTPATIHIAAGMDLHVAIVDGKVVTGKTVDDVYASDTKMTADETMAYADALTAAATFLLASKAG
jgi:hypothetical protein